MATETITLPKDPAALARILWRHANRCEQTYMYRRTNWLLAWYYMNGYRRFNVFDPATGALSPHILDEAGNLEYQCQELLFHINQVAGRIQSMDFRPSVRQEGFSLAGQRSRSITQITASSIFNADQIDLAKEEFAYMFACLGFAGIIGHMHDHPTIGLVADVEVIHPKELMPFPLVGQNVAKQRGLMRQRWVPLDYLKSIYGRKIENNLDRVEWYQMETGEQWADWDEQQPNLAWYTSRHTSATESAEVRKKEFLNVVKVRELWLSGPAGTCSRYVASSGEYCFDDQDLSGLEVYCPIGYARFMNNGSFYGAGMFDLMYSQHRQLERLQKSLYNNIIDLDRYGILVLPQGQLPQNNVLREVGRGLRAMFWDPDPVAEGFNPFHITPYNTGDLPGKVAQFAREGLNSINPIQDLIQEKGRVDSASGLQFLDEQITRALTSPTLGVTRAWGQMYRATTQRALSMLTGSKRSLPVGNLTLDLAGAIIDPETNSVSFSNNPLPDIARLSFSIRDVSPRSAVARKQEAIQLFQMGISQDPLAFTLFALKEDLDFAMWTDEDSGAYEMAIRSALVLYGDGSTPGQLILTPHTTRPELVLRVWAALMTSPVMQVASPAVHNAFKLGRETLISWMGLTLPRAVPNPDDAALLSMGAGSMPMLPGSMPASMPMGMSQGSGQPPMM